MSVRLNRGGLEPRLLFKTSEIDTSTIYFLCLGARLTTGTELRGQERKESTMYGPAIVAPKGSSEGK